MSTENRIYLMEFDPGMLSVLSLISTSMNTESGISLFPYLCIKTHKHHAPFGKNFTSTIPKSPLEPDEPLSGNQVDIVPQGRVVFSHLLRWRVFPGTCRLGWICICSRGSASQKAKSQQRCSYRATPEITGKAETAGKHSAVTQIHTCRTGVSQQSIQPLLFTSEILTLSLFTGNECLFLADQSPTVRFPTLPVFYSLSAGEGGEN